MDEESGIELVATDDLTVELMRRFTHGVVLLRRDRITEMPEVIHEMKIRWMGNAHVCIGMITKMAQDIALQIKWVDLEGEDADE